MVRNELLADLLPFLPLELTSGDQNHSIVLVWNAWETDLVLGVHLVEARPLALVDRYVETRLGVLRSTRYWDVTVVVATGVRPSHIQNQQYY